MRVVTVILSAPQLPIRHPFLPCSPQEADFTPWILRAPLPSVFRLVLANGHQHLRGQGRKRRGVSALSPLPMSFCGHSFCQLARLPRATCWSRSISHSLGHLHPGVEGTSCCCWGFMLHWPCPVPSPCPQRCLPAALNLHWSRSSASRQYPLAYGVITFLLQTLR